MSFSDEYATLVDNVTDSLNLDEQYYPSYETVSQYCQDEIYYSEDYAAIIFQCLPKDEVLEATLPNGRTIGSLMWEHIIGDIMDNFADNNDCEV